ncbi:hypothetical protein AXF42_Ash007456 [Apostasia shenzhenica]|uniref:Secreted protein n=1 Tax=Apostasia shenzhenica TaxID=1088818 RepID=A0A2I0BAB7_9ASPA|nr:hypothetical protein AXF42_Ash007456 [Apostasia shenzhenica]
MSKFPFSTFLSFLPFLSTALCSSSSIPPHNDVLITSEKEGCWRLVFVGGADGRVYHSHDGLAPHSHEPIYSPGLFSARAPPLVARDFQEAGIHCRHRRSCGHRLRFLLYGSDLTATLSFPIP